MQANILKKAIESEGNFARVYLRKNDGSSSIEIHGDNGYRSMPVEIHSNCSGHFALSYDSLMSVLTLLSKNAEIVFAISVDGGTSQECRDAGISVDKYKLLAAYRPPGRNAASKNVAFIVGGTACRSDNPTRF